MKKLLMIILVLALSLCLFACGDDEVPAGMQLASDTDIVDYKLFVPESWTVVNNGNATSQALVSEKDETRTNVIVMQWNITDNTSTVENWWEIEYKPQVFDTEVLKDCVVVKNEDGTEGKATTLDGKAAKRYVYTGRMAETFFKYDVTACINNGSIYIVQIAYMQDESAEGAPITFSAEQTYAEDIQKILDNFRFN